MATTSLLEAKFSCRVRASFLGRRRRSKLNERGLACSVSCGSTLRDLRDVLVEVRNEREREETSFRCHPGKSLRSSLLENEVQLYTAWNKVWCCKGQGQCGSCHVRVIEGNDLLSEKTQVEISKLRGKPDSWRLACQTAFKERPPGQESDRGRSDCIILETLP